VNPVCPLMMNHARFQECVLAHRESIIAALQQERDSLTRAASEIGQIKSAQRSSAELSRTTGGEPRPIARSASHTHTHNCRRAGETKKIVKVADAGCVTGEQQVQLEPADANLHPSLQPRTDAFAAMLGKSA
jgi:hypothetical protein